MELPATRLGEHNTLQVAAISFGGAIAQRVVGVGFAYRGRDADAEPVPPGFALAGTVVGVVVLADNEVVAQKGAALELFFTGSCLPTAMRCALGKDKTFSVPGCRDRGKS